jgi:uncharacterized protein (DUF58 family)
MTIEHVTDRPGLAARVVDRVKRPMFMGFFLMAMVGAALVHPVLFAVGTLGFVVVGAVHLLSRRSSTPLLGNYLGFGRYLRVTREGRILIALELVLGLAAVNARINLLLLVFGMAMVVTLISGILSESSLRRLSVKVFVPSTAFANVPFPARVTLRNGKRRMPSYSLRLEIYFEGHDETLVSRSYVLKVPAGRSATLEHLVNIDARGRKVVRRVRVATRFPFGIFEKWSYLPVEAEVLMFPAVGRIPGRIIPTGDEYRHAGATKVLAKSGRDEFWGIREYREGDNPRHIHWRSAARLGKRMVKEYHREESQNVCLLLDAHVPPDRPELRERFERAVSFVATLSRDLVAQDFGVSFAAYGQSMVKLATGRGQRQGRQVLTALAEIEASPDRDFEAMLRELDPRVIGDAYIVAIVLDGARERAARIHLARARNHRLRVISVDSPAFGVLFKPPEGEKQIVPGTISQPEARA